RSLVPPRCRLLLFPRRVFAPSALRSSPSRRSSDLGDGSFFGDWGTFGLRDVVVRFAKDRLTQYSSYTVAEGDVQPMGQGRPLALDRKSTRLNSSHVKISYAVFCLKKKRPRLVVIAA